MNNPPKYTMPLRTRMRIRYGMFHIWLKRTSQHYRTLHFAAPVVAFACFMLVIGIGTATPMLSAEAAAIYVKHQQTMAYVALDVIEKSATQIETEDIRQREARQQWQLALAE